MEDWSCPPIALLVLVYSVHGDNPRIGHCLLQVNKSHVSYIPQLSVPSRGTTGWKQTVVSVVAPGCTQDWLCVEHVLPFSVQQWSPGRRWKSRGAFPGQWFHFFMLNFKPNAFLWLKQDKGQQASTLPPKPTRMKVTSHWFHAKVQSCTLAPQLHYSESQASLVSRNAFRVDLFRISRKIFYLCVFPHLRAAPGSTVGGLLVFKQLCLVPETETTLLWAHLRQHLYFSEGANPSSLLSNAIAKFSFPKTEPWYAMGILSGASASSLCTWRVLLSSVKEGPVYSSGQPGSDNNLLISLLLAVVFKCQIAIRAECSDQVRSLVTVWLALLSPCARWMRNTHLCFPRYFLCVFKNFLKWAWYLCFSIWRHGHVVGFFHVFTDIYIYIFVCNQAMFNLCAIFICVCVMVATLIFSLITFTVWSCSDYNTSECRWILGTCKLQDREHPDARINLWKPSCTCAALVTFANFVPLPEVQVLLDKAMHWGLGV